MIEISKKEKDYLIANGCRWHNEIFASTTRRHYYAREDARVMRLIAKQRSTYTSFKGDR